MRKIDRRFKRIYLEKAARYEFLKGNMKECRGYLRRSNLNLKNLVLYFASFSKSGRKFILDHFDILAVKRYKEMYGIDLAPNIYH